MRRRRLLQASGAAAVAAVAGCLGDSTPPPRRSNAISDVSLDGQDQTLVTDVADDPWVMSRFESGSSGSLDAPTSLLAALSPVGVAGAQKGGGRGGGSGATGRGTGGYRSAPRTHHGYAHYHGDDDDDDWYENHRDEVTRYAAAAGTLGFAYLGSNAAFTDDPPGPGPVPWDETVADPGDVERFDVPREGWYRVGTRLNGQNVNHDFGWACLDVRVDEQFGSEGYDIEETWKVSPRV
jgi:hypothetical protein